MTTALSARSGALTNPAAVEAAAAAISERNRQDARTPATRRTYASIWRAWRSWCATTGESPFPARPPAIIAYLNFRETHPDKPASIATLRMIRSAIADQHRTLADNPAADPAVADHLKAAAADHRLGDDPLQAAGLTASDLAAIRATACIARPGRGGKVETSAYAHTRGQVDIALVSLMRDCLLRRSEAAAARWDELTTEADGSGRLAVYRRKTRTRQECYVSPPTMDALNAIRGLGLPDTTIFDMTPAQIQARIAAAAAAAGLTGRYTGHSPRVGMAQDLTAANIGLPAVIQAGAWKSSRMPARYAAKQAAATGAVAQYYAQG